MKQLEFTVLIITPPLRPLHHEHHGTTACNDVDSRPTFRTGVHRIYLAAPLKARHGFLYIFAESSRLYLRNCSSTSKYAGERQNTRSARVRRRVNIAGLLPFRHSRLASALV